MDITILCIKDQISRQSIFYRNLHTILRLIAGNSWKYISILLVNALYKSGTIRSIRQACASPYIWIADKLRRKFYHRSAKLTARDTWLGRCQRIIACHILFRLHRLFCKRILLFPGLFHGFRNFFSPCNILALYESTDITGFHIDPFLAFVSEDRRGVGLLLNESLEWNVAFPAMQIQNKFLKKIGFITWRDEKAIHAVTQKYIDELAIKCTSSRQKARELSGGNQQKVCLAKAFALEPKFLFVSEPTRGIDVGAKALVLESLKKFNRDSGVTVVMISSELEELRQTCDRIAIVSGGKIAGILPASESSEEFGMLMVSQVK